MEQDFFSQLQKFANMFSGKFNILEEEVDVDTQMAYHKMSKKIKKTKEEYNLNDLVNLDDENLSEDEKKETLIKLANLDDPKVYGIIEEYSKKAPEHLKDWSLMALQESRMLMESVFGDENQVFISTGLGGKGKMLRYFVALIANGNNDYDDFQKKIIQSEFEFLLKNNQSELESIVFEKQYALMTVLIPFTVQFNFILKKALEECNQYGNFLKDNFLVTNVKKFTTDDLDRIIEEEEKSNISELDILDDFEEIDGDDD